LLLAPGLAHAGDDYATTFTPEADQVYQEDINVWVYTQAFADRFGMPEKWVSGDLEGAHAAAFRVETASVRLMFPHKGKDVSKPVRRCVLDLFLPSEADIPWANDKVADMWWYTPEAPTYLMPQREKDKQWQRRPVGFPTVAGIIQFGTSREHLGSLSVRRYDRELYPGVVYVSISKSCVTPPKRASWIEFHEYEPRKSSKKYPNPEILGVTHKVKLPGSFMRRLYNRWYQENRQPAGEEWNKVIESGK
jgi:hypothetical protein